MRSKSMPRISHAAADRGAANPRHSGTRNHLDRGTDGTHEQFGSAAPGEPQLSGE